MRKILLLALLLCAAQAEAQTPAACEGAAATLQDYLQALRGHQLDTVRQLLDPALAMKVEWLESSPSKFFTFSREDYLQQLKATWHFGREERIGTGPLQWQTEGNACEVRFTLTEKRLLLDTPTGQENQLRMHLENTAGSWRINRLQTRTRTW